MIILLLYKLYYALFSPSAVNRISRARFLATSVGFTLGFTYVYLPSAVPKPKVNPDPSGLAGGRGRVAPPGPSPCQPCHRTEPAQGEGRTDLLLAGSFTRS